MQTAWTLNGMQHLILEAINSKAYADKTELLDYTASVLHTSQQYICVSRPRCFGKSMAVNVLAVYTMMTMI